MLSGSADTADVQRTKPGASLNCQNITATTIEIGASEEGESGRIVV